MNNQSISRYESYNKSEIKKIDQDVMHLILALLEQEFFGVLCTQAKGKPYGSIVAFAFDTDLKTFIFGTPRETRKYHNLIQCDRVALVIDSRDQFPDEINRIEAVTITGSAQQVEPGLVFDTFSQLYVERHPELKPFIDSTSTALFRIHAENFTYVTQFQKVHHWTPLTGG